MIAVRHLSFRFDPSGPDIVSDISFDVGEGDFVSVVGLSGSGKTTLLRQLAGFLKPTSGTVSINGQTPQLAKQNGGVGYMWQEESLLPWLSVSRNVELPLKLKKEGMGRSERQNLVADIVDQVGLSASLSQLPGTLSGGMKQRVALARSLILNPSVLLIDEPFSALDEITRSQILDLLVAVTSHIRTTTVMVTHNLRDAIRVSSSIIVLGGKPGKVAGRFHPPSAEVGEARLYQSRETLFEEIVNCLQSAS